MKPLDIFIAGLEKSTGKTFVTKTTIEKNSFPVYKTVTIELYEVVGGKVDLRIAASRVKRITSEQEKEEAINETSISLVEETLNNLFE